MNMTGHDSLKTRTTLTAAGKTYSYFSIPTAAKALNADPSRLPVSLKILLENVLRFENGGTYKVSDAQSVLDWAKQGSSTQEVPFRPARILMQDFTGVPAVVDLAAMRDGITGLGGNPQQVNPLVPWTSSSTTPSWWTSPAPPTPWKRTSPPSSPATASATPSSAGARTPSRTSASSPRRRHLPPGQLRVPRRDRLDHEDRR